MLRIHEYGTVCYGNLFIVSGFEVVERDGKYILRHGRKPNGGSQTGLPEETVLPKGSYAELTVEVSDFGTAGIKFIASGWLCRPDGTHIVRLNEPCGGSASFAHKTPEGAIRSFAKDGFEARVRYRIASSQRSGATWAEAIEQGLADPTAYRESEWFQQCVEAVRGL